MGAMEVGDRWRMLKKFADDGRITDGFQKIDIPSIQVDQSYLAQLRF